MSDDLPPVTVVIAARPGQADVLAVTASQTLDYPREKLEIIVARGTQPAVQRNAATQAAHGEWIYFLDDDSLPRPDNLRRAIEHLNRADVQMLGGPNLCPPEAPPLEQAFALVLGSWVAFGPSRARYTPVGKPRETSEKELILCNLMVRRSEMLEIGGFDEALYPNEENALMDELQKRGGKLLYDPDFAVYRRPRHSLAAFVKMLMNYGRGRAEQFRLHPTPGSALNFVPPLFCVYLVVAALLRGWLLWPLAAYLAVVLVQTLALSRKSVGSFLRVVPLIVLTHIFYGLGFWRGLFTSLKAAPDKARPVVTLQTIQAL